MPGKTCSWIEGGRFGRRYWKGQGSEKGWKLVQIVEVISKQNEIKEYQKVKIIWNQIHLKKKKHLFKVFSQVRDSPEWWSSAMSQVSDCFFLVHPAFSCLIIGIVGCTAAAGGHGSVIPNRPRWAWTRLVILRKRPRKWLISIGFLNRITWA